MTVLSTRPSRRITKRKRKSTKSSPAYQFSVVIEPDEGGFHVYVPSLPGCHSFGSTLEQARANIVEAIELHIEGLVENRLPVPVDRVVVERLVLAV